MPPQTPRPPSLYTPSAYNFYDSGREAEFRAAVKAQADAATVSPIDEVRGLIMDQAGALPGGFRYTPEGLRQVCNLMCGSLYRTLVDLAGGAGVQGPVAAEYSFPEALRLYNELIRRRAAPRIVEPGVRLLRDARQKTVEGTLGSTYHRISNAQILEMADNAVSEFATFHHGAMAGRRLSLRYRSKRPLFEVQPGGPVLAAETYRLGYHFANSEIGSECAIHASILLIRDRDGSASAGHPLGRGRVVHTGRQLGAKLGRLFDAVGSAPSRIGKKTYVERMASLAAQSLDLPPSGDPLAARLADLQKALKAHDMPRAAAEAAVAVAAHSGSYPSGGRDVVGRRGLAGRTSWDLYNAIAATAATHHAATRDKIERVAWHLFDGKVKI